MKCTIQADEDKSKFTKCILNCEKKFNSFLKYFDRFEESKSMHSLCLIKCTDKLNFPSDELTCYDKCEEVYHKNLECIKDEIIFDFNKIIN